MTNTQLSRRSSDLLRCAVLVIAVLACGAWLLFAEKRIAGEWGFSLDDSWIYAVFARNIATWQGYSFNPGEHISGATGPLYALILAVFYAMFRDVVLPAKVFGIACLCTSSILVYFAARAVDPESRIKPLLVGLLVGISPSLLWGAVSGMEISLYVLLVSLGAYFYARSRWTLAAVAWSLGVWVRPDGMFLALAGIVLRPRPSVPSVAKTLLAVAPIFAAFFAFNYWVGGAPLPNSVLVKTHVGRNAAGALWDMARQWTSIWGIEIQRWDFATHAILLLPAMVAGAFLLAKRFPALGAYALGLPFALAIAGASGGAHGRYIMPAIPLSMILAVEGLDRASRRLWPRRHAFALAVLAVIALGWQVRAMDRMGGTHGWNVQNINRMQRLLGGLLQRNASPGDTVAVNDVGAIGYFSGCYIADLVGLVTPHRTFPENLRIYKPKYIVIFPTWYEQYFAMDRGRSRWVLQDPDSHFVYLPFVAAGLRNNTISSRDQMVVFGRFRRDEEWPEKIQTIWN